MMIHLDYKMCSDGKMKLQQMHHGFDWIQILPDSFLFTWKHVRKKQTLSLLFLVVLRVSTERHFPVVKLGMNEAGPRRSVRQSRGASGLRRDSSVCARTSLIVNHINVRIGSNTRWNSGTSSWSQSRGAGFCHRDTSSCRRVSSEFSHEFSADRKAQETLAK